MLVVVDGVFSMEGDVAPLAEIAELCERYGARLMVDEAHGVGVLGARGAGACELLGVEDRVDLRMGTFSKSLASCGGFIAGPADVIEYLRFSARAFMFTASAVPAALGAALAAAADLPLGRGSRAARAVLENACYLHDGLQALGFRRPGEPVRFAASDLSPDAGDGRARERIVITPIVPVLVGDDWKAALLWRALYDARRVHERRAAPGRAAGGALLRTSVMATHDRATLDRALERLRRRVKRSFEAEHGPLAGRRRLEPRASIGRAVRSPPELVHFFTRSYNHQKARF